MCDSGFLIPPILFYAVLLKKTEQNIIKYTKKWQLKYDNKDKK